MDIKWERETSFVTPVVEMDTEKTEKIGMENHIGGDPPSRCNHSNSTTEKPATLPAAAVGPNQGENSVEAPVNQPDTPSNIPDTPASESNDSIPPFKPRSSVQYQLVFGMDDESSETSISSSIESSNPLLAYLPAGSHDLLPMSSDMSHDLSIESHDTGIGSHDSASERDSTITGIEGSTAQGDETLSVYSSSTLIAESTVLSTNGQEKQETAESLENQTQIESEGDVKDEVSVDTKLSSGETPTNGDAPPETRPVSNSPNSVVDLNDIHLHSRSGSETPPPKPKLHPLAISTSDSEAPLSPLLSPSEYFPDEIDTEEGKIAILPSSPLPPGVDSPTLFEDQPLMSILFSGITYLGSSSVDAPVSEIEANRKMFILKQQAATSDPIPVVLSIPLANDGMVRMMDPDTDQLLTAFPVKYILFCARGSQDNLSDCFSLNVRHKRSGVYHCHVFKCEIMEACQKVFEAIGRAFKTKAPESSVSSPTPELTCEFDVTVEIHEEDGKGSYNPVPMDKDCFKLRQNMRKKVILTVAQPGNPRPLVVERCFGMLISPGKDVKHSEMNLLDNMNCTVTDSVFSVAGLWDVGVPFLAPLNEETPKSHRHQYMTIAADLVLESVTEPVRFMREVKVRVSKGETWLMAMGISSSSLYKKKNPPEAFFLTLRKSEESVGKKVMYSVVELRNTRKAREAMESKGPSHPLPHTFTPSPEQDHRPQLILAEEPMHPSPSQRKRATSGGRSQVGKLKDAEHDGDSDNSQPVEEWEDEPVVSGWGEVDDMREELLKDWGELLEKWDGRDKARPKQLVKLCKKGIPRHLRCHVWQLLSGAAYDPQLLEAYRLLITKESPTETVINWDIKRTYVGHDFFQDGFGRESLYKISKAYSVYDEEVGYCQGFSFMAAVLLLQKMPEEQAFSMMVKIMYNYGQRDLFKANFQSLHRMFFQLDRLMEEYLSDLYQHFQVQHVETHMFASQWFLTLYTAKFPLSVVFRIMDIYLCLKTPVIFHVALALLKIARKDLLALDFEGILNYFRVSLPKKFQTEDDCKHFFHTVLGFTGKVTERKLRKLEKDYHVTLEQEAQLEDPVKRLERENKQLRDTIIRLEQENDHLAQELVTSKVSLRAEMDKLEERIDTLSKECRAHKSAMDAAQLLIGELREELQQAKQEYQKVMMQLMEEKQQHDVAIAEYKQLFQQLDEGHQKQKEELNQELMEVKAKLGSVGSGGEASGDTEQHLSSLSSEQRLRNLELELAQTKLALVESQCKNQELEHRVEELLSGQSLTKVRNWLNPKKK